jgi:hypothetical protein
MVGGVASFTVKVQTAHPVAAPPELLGTTCQYFKPAGCPANVVVVEAVFNRKAGDAVVPK